MSINCAWSTQGMGSSRTVLDLKDSSRTKSRGIGLGLEHSVLELIPGSTYKAEMYECKVDDVTLADPEILQMVHGWRQCMQPRRHLSQMHTKNYMPFMREKAACWIIEKKFWANKGAAPCTTPLNPPLFMWALLLWSRRLRKLWLPSKSTF